MNAFFQPISLRIAAVITGIMLSSVSISAQENDWDTGYIDKDSFFLAGLKLGRILEATPQDSDVRQTVRKAIIKETKINIDELNQIQFAMSGKSSRSNKDISQLKFLFSREQEFTGIVKAFLNHHEDAQFEGKKFKRSLSSPYSVYYPNKTTLLRAMEPTMRRVMKSETGKGPLVERMLEFRKTDGFVVFEFNENADAFMESVVEMIGTKPFDLRSLASETKHGYAKLVIDSDVPVAVLIVTKDEEGAERLKRATEALVGLAIIGNQTTRTRLKRQHNETEGVASELQLLEIVKDGLGFLSEMDELLSGTSVKVNGNKVIIEMKKAGGIEEGVREFFGLYRSGLDFPIW